MATSLYFSTNQKESGYCYKVEFKKNKHQEPSSIFEGSFVKVLEDLVENLDNSEEKLWLRFEENFPRIERKIIVKAIDNYMRDYL